MAGEEENKKGESKGFAGLSSLVSDVGTTPPASKPASTGAPPGAVPKVAHQPPKPLPLPHQEPKEPSSGSSGGKWVLGIAIVVGALWLIGQLDKPSSSPTPAYTPSAQAPSSTASGTPAPPPPPETPSAPEEVMPPVGSDLVLSTAQIRYCLAEDIRMNAAKSVVDSYNDSEVDRFNMMVTDYNSRCGSFRYRSGALESARRDVEPYRSQLIEEGRSRLTDNRQPQIQSSISEGDGWSQAPQVEEQTQTTEAPPSADAATDQDTANPQSASFEPITPPSTSTSDAAVEIDSIHSSDPEARKAGPPANSFVSGANWYCNSGFRKVGDRCEALVVPENAFVSGANWYCNSGFRKVGDRCEALVVPENAFVSGANWYCNSGYRKVGDQCVSIFKQ